MWLFCEIPFFAILEKQNMNALTEIKSRFAKALGELTDDPASLLNMIVATQNADHGDCQDNCAMPLGKKDGKPPRQIADDLVNSVDLADICLSVEVAGPGFINLRLDEGWMKTKLSTAMKDERLGVAPTDKPRKYVVDFSSPNVAKEMHVGHIRSTVIGDAISKILRFVGHEVVTDNHIGDWGTQFGMIIYGYKHFCDQEAYSKEPVKELARLYKYVRKLMDYHSAIEKLPKLEKALEDANAALAAFDEQPQPEDKSAAKKAKKERKGLASKAKELHEAIFGKEEIDSQTK